jgi:peptide/nickel transport system substrate-binding protein
VKRGWIWIGLVVLLLAAGIYVIVLNPGGETPPPRDAQTTVRNPDTLTVADLSDIESLDPHFAYDTSSAEIIFHVYDNLIMYDGPSTETFVPMLATQVPSIANGLITENPDGSVVIRFPIRQGIRFHNGNSLTADDVAYSFQRLMLLDRSGGPSWLVIEPLLLVHTIEDLAKQLEEERTGTKADEIDFNTVSAEALVATCERVKQAVQVRGNEVEFHLPKPFPPFLAIVAHSGSWAAILDREWAAEQGAWDGSCTSWKAHHDPQVQQDPLYEKMNGTGPFQLERWDHATGDISLVRNENYWRGPAQLARIVVKKVNEFSTRKLMLQNGDADIAIINRAFVDQVDGTPGIRLIKGQVSMSLAFILFNQKITVEGNPYIGSGRLDGHGIPPDFFSDIDVRKGFNYAFDWETLLREALKNEGEQARGPMPRGVPYFNPENPVYRLDLQKAEEHLRRAWGGQVWQVGFKFTAPYLVDSQASRIAFEILRRNLQRLNPKFEIETVNLEWSALLGRSVDGTLPVYSAGWLEDYHDAHNWAFPLMHSKGNYTASLNLGGKYDALIEQGINELEPAKRQEIYYELQRLAYEDAIAIFTYQALGRHYQQRWVDGYYYNPTWPGRNFYVLAKKPDAKPNMAYINQLGLAVQEW